MVSCAGRIFWFGGSALSGTAERAVPRHYDVPLMRTSGTSVLLLPINRSAEEVSSWIHAGGIDVVVFGVFAHLV